MSHQHDADPTQMFLNLIDQEIKLNPESVQPADQDQIQRIHLLLDRADRIRKKAQIQRLYQILKTDHTSQNSSD